MKQYLDLLRKILDEGVEKESGRENMPNTIGISKGEIEMDLSKGFPLLTTKPIYWKGVIHELLWFLHGDTNVKYLIDNKVNIWTEHAYGWYEKHMKANTGMDANHMYHDNGDGTLRMLLPEEFEELIKNRTINELKSDYTFEGYTMGDLGKIYGYQWRNQNGVDQVKDVVEGLQNAPYSRYHVIDAWNKADFKYMALPPCHLLYQFIVRPLALGERNNLASKMENRPHEVGHNAFGEFGVPKFYLDLNMYQRSCDTILGVPFNIASMSLLLLIMAKVANMIPGKANWVGGDTHLYVNHLPAVDEQLARRPGALPKVKITKDLKTLDDIMALTVDDFDIIDYYPRKKLENETELFTGVKKA